MYGIYGCTALVTAIIVSQPSTKLFGGFQSQTISAISALNVHRQKITEKHKKDMLDERDQKTKLFIKLKELQVELWSLGIRDFGHGLYGSYIMLYHVSVCYLRAAAPAADPGRSGKEAKLAARPFCYVHRCEIYLIGLNFHV